MPFIEHELSVHERISADEEELNLPIRNLCQWTGITQEMLPPAAMLTDGDVHEVLLAMKKMLGAYNCHFILQTEVPEALQYETIRQNLDQDVKVMQWFDGFFELCKPGTEHKKCVLGEYCQCAFYEELFSGYANEELTAEDERARELEIELQYIRRKYGDDWMKYYPYHLDKNYDDDSGNPYNYGLEDDDENKDDWWRK